ncbi:hypothetical protein NBH15_03705 [Parabacteroides sp. W1-Q-101]|uniref:hypothetical protein n=1 Tax=Parabacteroides caeci TaxID=2949650 RepID=UPI0020303D44|nr:hypothetical protein [Parabacteroides sp. W1-Q-101]MCM0717375.1 hypothetical protein [Parabacteroides sp. W1-Q-101]
MISKNQATASTLEAVPVKPGLSALAKGILFISVFFALLGMAGHSDYIDDVYYSIPDAAFEEIALKLGDRATRSEIVDEYMDSRAYYDALASYGTSEISRIFPED